MTATGKESLLENARNLIAQKEAIELEIQTQLSILNENNTTTQTPLVDRDGFPRADIDIWAVRTARVRLIELRNDLRDVMEKTGKILERIYDPESSTEVPSHSSSTVGQGSNEKKSEPVLKPFTRVESVAPGSPAAEAGLQAGDLLVRFGQLDESSFKTGSLQPVADLVAESENRTISLRIIRAEVVMILTLVPRKNWGGRGMLGCHIVPYRP